MIFHCEILRMPHIPTPKSHASLKLVTHTIEEAPELLRGDAPVVVGVDAVEHLMEEVGAYGWGWGVGF